MPAQFSRVRSVREKVGVLELALHPKAQHYFAIRDLAAVLTQKNCLDNAIPLDETIQFVGNRGGSSLEPVTPEFGA